MEILELGCGPNKRHKDSIAIDVNPKSKADVIHNLNVFPYPFKNNTFDRVICEHVLEHLDDIIKVLEEIHRISKPRAIIEIRVPHFSSVYAYTDPTHRRFFSTKSFDYFTDGYKLSDFHYSDARFKKIKAEIQIRKNNIFKKLLSKIINKYNRIYEEKFAFIFPRHEIYFELEVVK